MIAPPNSHFMDSNKIISPSPGFDQIAQALFALLDTTPPRSN